MLPELTAEETADGLDSVAMEILHAAGVTSPPIDAFVVAAALGISVAMDDRQQGRARYVRLAGYRRSSPQAAILVHSDPRVERQQWAVAHEIGEHAAYRAFNYLGVDPCETGPNARETVANQLAGRLLLPSEWFAADAAVCHWDLSALKARYATASHELIARRMLECHPPVIVSIFDHSQLYFRRSNLPGQVPPLSSAEMACLRSVHRDNRPGQTCDGPHTIQGWPVHEEGWKREILRTEVEPPEVDVW